MEKFQFFDQNPLEKSQFFFDFLILESKNTFFFFLEYRQTHLLTDFAKNKKMNKFQIIDQNHGPLEKYQFLNFFNFVILESKNPFFLSRTSSNTFSCLILPKIKGWKNFKFLTKAMDLPLWKNPDFFFTFVTSCFL